VRSAHKPKKIFIASDHGGFALKSIIYSFLKDKEYDIVNLGTDSEDSIEYPDIAGKLCRIVQKDKSSVGILICGAGIGMSIAANKYKGIRAALCSDAFSAQMSREHNDANVLCLGGRVLGEEIAKQIVEMYLKAQFQGGRHARRVGKIPNAY